MTARVPLYVHIQDHIRNGIKSRLYKEGDRLPSESELAERFATTRATVARAMQQLVFESLISRKMGSGTFVAHQNLVDSVDTNVLESFEEHVRASGELIDYKVLSYEKVRGVPDVAKHLGCAQAETFFHLRRLRIIKNRALAIELRYLPQQIGVGIKPDWLAKHTIQDILQQRLGLHIDRIENVVRASTASVLLAQSLDVRKGAALLVREHTIFGSGDRPLLFGNTYYRTDFSLRYTLRASAHPAV